MHENILVMTECSDNLQKRWQEIRALGESVCLALSNEVVKLGMLEKAPQIAPWPRARFELQKDPASGQSSLIGQWRDAGGQRVGSIVFHCDGSFYAEYDVVEQHPNDSRWFVEAVVAWGKNDTIKSEARLLPAVS